LLDHRHVRRRPDDSQVVEKGFEGLVVKGPHMSPYVGVRTLKWLKVKQPRYREGERGWEPKK